MSLEDFDYQGSEEQKRSQGLFADQFQTCLAVVLNLNPRC